MWDIVGWLRLLHLLSTTPGVRFTMRPRSFRRRGEDLPSGVKTSRLGERPGRTRGPQIRHFKIFGSTFLQPGAFLGDGISDFMNFSYFVIFAIFLPFLLKCTIMSN